MSNRLFRFLVLLLVPALASCASSGTPRPSRIAIPLPQAVLVEEKGAATTRLHVKSVVAGGALTSGFGQRGHSMGGFGAQHDGLDIVAPAGTPVRAAAAGTLVDIGWRGPYGRFVLVRHSRDTETAYAHLSSYAKSLKIGQRVQQDDVIGYVGSSGRSTGPHLHFEVRHRGQPVDPLGFPRARATQS